MMSSNFLPQLETLKPRDQWQGSLVWMAVISDAFGQHLSLWIIGTLFTFARVYWSFGNLTSRARLFMDAFPPGPFTVKFRVPRSCSISLPYPARRLKTKMR